MHIRACFLLRVGVVVIYEAMYSLRRFGRPRGRVHELNGVFVDWLDLNFVSVFWLLILVCFHVTLLTLFRSQ